MTALEIARKLLEAPNADVVVLLNKANETCEESYSPVVIDVDASRENNIAILVLDDKKENA